MPKAKLIAVEQLRTLNELLGRVSDPERAEHARRALEFAYKEHPEDLGRASLLEDHAADLLVDVEELGHGDPAREPGELARLAALARIHGQLALFLAH